MSSELRAAFEEIMQATSKFKPEMLERRGDGEYALSIMRAAWEGFVLGAVWQRKRDAT